MKLWQFEALDSLFFRGAKSFNQGEGGFLDSQFPPSAQTLAGVMRATIAESMGVDWKRLHQGEQAEIATLIGKEADDAGGLEFAGPYIFRDEERLYPVPLHLLYSESAEEWSHLRPSKNRMATDMGDVCLPEVVDSQEGAKPLENAWLDAANMQKVLQGENPGGFIRESELFEYEIRTGIGRDNEKKKAIDSMLYFTRHVRLKAGVSLSMGVSGADHISPARMVRLGGEGRMANVRITDMSQGLNDVNGKNGRAIIVLLTHADFGDKSETNWDALGVTCISACIGKAVREGGWDYKQRKPKPLKSLMPAGSVFFVKGDVSGLGTHIGKRTKFGYGEIAIGVWEE